MGKTILITGANRGIGLELTREFSAHGWRVLACCRDPQVAGELKNLAERLPEALRIFPLEVTDSARIQELSAVLADEAIDILLNNAGVSGPERQDFGAIDTDAWLRTFRINSIAPLDMAAAFVEQVARSRRKIIATVGSQLGSLTENTEGGMYAYRSSKAAAHMVTKNLAIDLHDRGIIAVALHPGWVRTRMGGPEAPVMPRQSAAELFQVLTSLTLKDSGKLWAHTGQVLPW
ncbi:SDR family oxidoreductase [Trichloromonas sp.]|uniref:SDR family oxidoreductase n=1 Tax=Trichloromonas sp. TaxID=3069249 RepID=UPI002A39A84B|nr:SDR family oxidoreductase [Trichloromonas sp.]